ncbi:hypothetical protein FOE78_06665 [Microlunatus elymi]|uniref:Uncharacterized protein n=1 Tax=Microlunatus elymi TaxID=2596828 RepID=A0A516PXE9_9ACTN|nr:DUF6350 family protein [Microlunatus elymi]QDP95631.1 hypothetical protein FOE78_06665 [Microlunatus elymi]
MTATEPTEPISREQSEPTGPRYGWQLVAVAGGLATALAGWVIVAGLSVVGWLAATRGEVGDALQVGTTLWLLANGAPAQLGSVTWSVVPLGMSLLIVFMISRFARAAVRYAAPEPAHRRAVGLGTVGLCSVSYAAAVAAVGLATGAETSYAILGAAVIAVVGSTWGSVRGLRVRVWDRLPGWARPVPLAVACAVGVLLLAGIAVLVTGVLLHLDRITALSAGLGAGVVGGIALWVAQAAFLPNIIVWCASYALGAGFSIGQGSVVAPSGVTLGLLPSIPALGALPATGPGSDRGLFWLASGVVAGAVAALIVVRRRPAARFDETALVGGLAGLLAGLVFTGLAFFTGGDLGDGRLAGTGPRLVELLVMSGTLLGLAGLICGLVFGLIAHLRRRSARTAEATQRTDAGSTASSSPAAEQSVDDGAGKGAVAASREVDRADVDADVPVGEVDDTEETVAVGDSNADHDADDASEQRRSA